MKKCFVVLFVVVISLPSISLFAQEMDMQEMMKVWMDYMTPGPMHEMLAKNVGTWNTSTTFWNYPGAEPATSEGTAVMESILGGRYFKTVHHSTVMGMPMEGWSIDGYDNGKKVFMSIWIDNMGTGLAQSFGSYDEATSTFNHIGTMYDAMADKDMEFRSVTKIFGENKMVFEMYADFQGQEFKMMEMVYTR
jgi:hypothetical protein